MIGCHGTPLGRTFATGASTYRATPGSFRESVSVRQLSLKLLEMFKIVCLLTDEGFDDRMLDGERPARCYLRGDDLDATVLHTAPGIHGARGSPPSSRAS